MARLPGKLGSDARERHCFAITRLLIQSGENFVPTNSTEKVFREYWCTAAPTIIRASCKSVKNSPESSKRLTASDRRAKLLTFTFNYDCVSCHTGISSVCVRFAVFKAPGKWYTLSLDLSNVKISFSQPSLL